MPYFKNNNINLLFIHIPKTGGTSLEYYFSEKYKIPLDNNALYGFIDNEIKIINNIKIDSSLQHLTYKNIINYKDFLKIDNKNIEIITIVRNPYERCISDLFFFGKININYSKNQVSEILKIHLKEHNDNHVLPQYLFIIDENKKIINNIKILYTETLNNDMHNLNYIDFNLKIQNNPNKLNYYDYLNKESIDIINNYYEKDFEIFNYSKI